MFDSYDTQNSFNSTERERHTKTDKKDRNACMLTLFQTLQLINVVYDSGYGCALHYYTNR